MHVLAALVERLTSRRSRPKSGDTIMVGSMTGKHIDIYAFVKGRFGVHSKTCSDIANPIAPSLTANP
ncbi:hypothetical protein RCCS2_10405 [Roseobacter sp. CCS2]|nr:hypothetical protein RCCS2_10405 [Roseobacter sp. CCS2]